MRTTREAWIALIFLIAVGYTQVSVSQQKSDQMSFFVTSRGSGLGADLGGLQGADAHCQALAVAAGAGHRTWRAYLSTQGPNAVDARSRIGTGPWYNARGELVAGDLDSLHRDEVNINHLTALDERGNPVPYARLDADGNVIPGPQQPVAVEHDILTGSRPDGTAFPPGEDMTCQNWTSSSGGAAMVGHHDRSRTNRDFRSWNSTHLTRGCSQQDLASSGGGGRLYCFAID